MICIAYVSSTTLQTFDLEALNSRSSTVPILKVPISPLLLVLEVCNVKPIYRKSCTANLLMWSDLTLDPSFKVKRGKPNLKVVITCLLVVLEVWDGKPTHRKSWAGNLLVWSDLNLGPCFKVKRG